MFLEMVFDRLVKSFDLDLTNMKRLFNTLLYLQSCSCLTDYKASKVGKTFLVLKKSTLISWLFLYLHFIYNISFRLSNKNRKVF